MMRVKAHISGYLVGRWRLFAAGNFPGQWYIIPVERGALRRTPRFSSLSGCLSFNDQAVNPPAFAAGFFMRAARDRRRY
jgi:hypothetical protein